LAGRPDIIFPAARTVVFVDGCFWHGCPDHFQNPQANSAFWTAKIARTKERDQQAGSKLRADGWHVIRIWEHEINTDVEACARKVQMVVRRRRF
jgi:DNA mismatch endonuclease (patch repair protein)